MDTSDPQAPTIVHAFMPCNIKGYTIKESWDVLGMRATRSDDTVLEGAVVPDQYIARVVATGAAGIDLFVLAIFAWAEPMFDNIYYALAQRAFDWTIDNVKKKTSLAMSRSMAYHAEVQHAIADMALELEAIGPHLDKIVQDWSDGIDHGHMWGAKLGLLSTGLSRGPGRWSIRRWTWLEVLASASSLGSSGSSAMHDWDVFTQLTPF